MASLFITTVAGRVDRKRVLVVLTVCMILSLALIALAPTLTVLMVARAILGITIGGFWSIATAVLMRLVPSDQVPRALGIMYTGQAMAAALAAPIWQLSWRNHWLARCVLGYGTFGCRHFDLADHHLA